MGTLNIFQTYSQKENATTNNVLLLFSRIYSNDPLLYNQLINSLLNQESLLDIVPSFKQQHGEGKGIADGHIRLNSSAIVIETKLHGLENIDKLIGYCDRLEGADTKILIHLSKHEYSENEMELIRSRIHSKMKDVHFASVTYQLILESLKQLREENSYNEEIVLLDEHFSEYCEGQGLISDHEFIMRALACGQSYVLNEKYAFYFDPADRGYRPHTYVGIYHDKRIVGIGKIEAVATADITESGELNIHWSDRTLTDEQKVKLKAAMLGAHNDGWQILKGHKFFMLEAFHKTNYIKNSKYGLQRSKYFDLREVLNMDELPETSKIAELLNGKNWEDHSS